MSFANYFYNKLYLYNGDSQADSRNVDCMYILQGYSASCV